jgi:hypothetical protein
VDACLVLGVHSGSVDVDEVEVVLTNMDLGVVVFVYMDLRVVVAADVVWGEVVTVVPSVNLVMLVDVIQK